jgi:predicted RNase H-related nuclease YkuK (DUF458 family)
MKYKTDSSDGKAEYFVSPSRGRRDFLQVIADVIKFIGEDVEAKYSVVVGTDSEVHDARTGVSEFVSVVVVHRIGRHGRYFWKKINDVRTFDRHDRILKEAFFSLDLAQRVVAELRDRLLIPYIFEIHLDIGLNGPTKEMIQEIVGFVNGSGFSAKIKPDAYAANKVADRHV